MKKSNDEKNKIKMSSKYKKAIIIILSVLVLAFALRILINKLNSKHEEKDDSIPVSVMEVKESEFEKYIEIYGTAKPEKESIIVPKIPATVEKINVKPGQVVKKGDILFIMNTEDINSQLKQAEGGYEIAANNYKNAGGAVAKQEIQQLKSSMEAAKINYEDTKLNHDRIKLLYESGGVSKQDFEQIENSVALLKNQYETAKKSYDLYVQEITPVNTSIAQSQLKQAEASYESAKKQYDDMIVRADIDGEIGISKVELGQTTGGSQGISMTVVDYKRIVLDMGVTQENVSRINQDSICKVKFDVIPGKEFSGKIESVGASTDPITALYQVKISIENNSGKVKPGMYAKVKIFDKSLKKAIMLPIGAVVNDGDNKYVFVLKDDNVAHKKPIITGADNGEVVAISSGIQIGEVIIFQGQDYLDDGDRVRITTQ